MDRLAALLASPAAVAAILAAVAWPSMTGFPTWGAFSRGRFASTLTVSLAVGVTVFTFALRLTARSIS